jgi:hypothetical protein
MAKQRSDTRSGTARRVGWLALLLLAPGCSPGVGKVAGTVTYQGKPVAGGTVTFYDAANGARSSPIADDGTYSIDKVPVGHARITVTVPVSIGFRGAEGAKPAGGPPAAKAPPVPAKYGDAEKSGLTYDVQAGGQKHDVTLD